MEDKVSKLLRDGLRDRWYPICPSRYVRHDPVGLERLGRKLVLWRDENSVLHALEDRCPHRGAPLSLGVIMGNRIACPYHGVEVRQDGIVAKVPGSPGCKLEGMRATESFHVKEHGGFIFIYNHLKPVDQPPPLNLPEELVSGEYEFFPNYAEWRTDYRYIQDNVMDPMHGAFVHKQSHSMFQGAQEAKFQIRDTNTGFIFEKTNQRGVNFDWAEFGDTNVFWQRLSIPYPKSSGPGGDFIIIGSFTPINPTMSAVVHWRCRKVQGWQSDAWKFLFKNRLEARHWRVLEQDRAILEATDVNARDKEVLYEHDLGLVRLRRYMRRIATEQAEAL